MCVGEDFGQLVEDLNITAATETPRLNDPHIPCTVQLSLRVLLIKLFHLVIANFVYFHPHLHLLLLSLKVLVLLELWKLHLNLLVPKLLLNERLEAVGYFCVTAF